MNTVRICALSALVLSMLAGCGGIHYRAEPPALPRAVIDPLPLEIGLYLPPSMQSHIVKNERSWAVVEFGPAAVSAVDQVVRGAFAKVSIVSTWPTDPAVADSPEIVIVPAVQGAQWNLTGSQSAAVWEGRVWLALSLHVKGRSEAKVIEIAGAAYANFGARDREEARISSASGILGAALRDWSAKAILTLLRDADLRALAEREAPKP